MAENAKDIVETGYDRIAKQYLEWSQASTARMHHLQELLACLPEHAEVLELGCGAGVPCSKMLAQHSRLTANDISAAQIALAKQNVPDATLIKADMMSLDFPPETFDAIVAFYSIIHLPRDEQRVLVTRLAVWLRLGGYLLVNLGAREDAGSVEADWLGSAMFWSSYDVDANQDMIRDAGLDIVYARIVCDDEHGEVVPFLWILARKTCE